MAVEIDGILSGIETASPPLVAGWGQAVIRAEIDGLERLAMSLGEDFERAVQLVVGTLGRVIVSGIGKSGHIGRKLAATMSATGSPALFVHPAEASHGDLGMLTRDDVLLAISNSGNTAELAAVIDHARLLGLPMIAISSNARSRMLAHADALIVLPEAREACPEDIAPTTSTAMTMAIGDALAVAAMRQRGFTRASIKALHPGGNIGAGARPVSSIMHCRSALPLVAQDASMRDVIVTITEMSFGIAGVTDCAGQLVGAISDGDLRRHLSSLFDRTACETMTRDPVTVTPAVSLNDALALMNREEITALFVVDAIKRLPVGIVHIHDLVRAGVS